MKVFLNLKLGGKLIVIGSIMALISLLLPWYSLSGRFGTVYMNGLEQKSYWILASLIYPFSIMLGKKNVNKKYASVSLLIGFVIWFISAVVMAPLEPGDGAVYESGSYWMLLSLIISLFGVLIIKNHTKMIKENSSK